MFEKSTYVKGGKIAERRQANLGVVENIQLVRVYTIDRPACLGKIRVRKLKSWLWGRGQVNRIKPGSRFSNLENMIWRSTEVEVLNKIYEISCWRWWPDNISTCQVSQWISSRHHHWNCCLWLLFNFVVDILLLACLRWSVRFRTHVVPAKPFNLTIWCCNINMHSTMHVS